MIQRISLILIALFALLLAATEVPAQEGPIYCRSNAQYSASSTGNTVIITGVAGRSVFICGFQLWLAGTATSVNLVYGTGVACATGETALTPPYALVAQTGIADTAAVFRGLLVPPATDVCIKTTTTQAVQAEVFYVQR